MEFLGSSEMLLVFPDMTMQLTTINNKSECPRTLYYSGLVSVEEIPNLNSIFADAPESYIIGTIANPINQVLLNLLAEELISGHYLEFEDPLNTAQIYIVNTLNDQQLQIGVFRLHFNVLSRRKKIEYVKRLKSQKYRLLRDYQRHLSLFQQAKQFCEIQENLVDNEKTHQEYLECHIHSAYEELKCVEDLTSPFLCTLCMDYEKNVLVFPCAHVIGCQFCLEHLFRKDQETNRTPLTNCLLCQTEVKEVKLLHYS